MVQLSAVFFPLKFASICLLSSLTISQCHQEARGTSIISPTVLKVGYLVPMSGSWDIGRAMAPSVPIALEEMKKRGFFDQYTVELSWKNSDCSPGRALAELAALVADGIHV